MLFFGHTGLTITAFYALERSMNNRGKKIAALIDYRLVLFGSLLPDLIDKPLGAIFPKALGFGHDYAHTLFFLFLITGIGLLLWWKYKRRGGLVLATACLIHLVLDSMWQQPIILLWPLYNSPHNFAFPNGSPKYWPNIWIKLLLTSPLIYISEIYGILVFWWFIQLHKSFLIRIIKYGRFE